MQPRPARLPKPGRTAPRPPGPDLLARVQPRCHSPRGRMPGQGWPGPGPAELRSGRRRSPPVSTLLPLAARTCGLMGVQKGILKPRRTGQGWIVGLESGS